MSHLLYQNERNMTNHELKDVLHFGKYEGKTLEEVLAVDREYIDWCLGNVDDFVVSSDVLLEIQKQYPEFQFSSDSLKELERKQLQLEEEVETDDYEVYDDFEDHDPMEEYGRSGEKYGWYNGWSDDVIDDAFEGDPQNTWNVD